MAFAIGTIVKLKSGGPDMTVYSIDRSHLNCQWFAGKKLERGAFHVETIELVKKAGN
ncbi:MULTISPECIES: YodC family protein [unclassified Pseudomonas]|jgi:Uncharacterized small protein|uniref:YodC family protein n=1 Tax=unclassified Pseudomonas TaxID=196821 RepID=UPI0009DA80A6|nr:MULTISPECIES: DUF2158 domain-containing protein [unclassified Pseudomonas]